jgi:hypothetical protein
MGINSEDYDIFVRKVGEEITANKPVGCCTDMENLLDPGEKKLKSKRCVSLPTVAGVDDNGKRLGDREHGNGSVTYEFTPETEAGTITDGRAEIWNAYNSDTDVKLTITIEIDDGTGVAGTGTRYERDVLITNVVPVDDGDGEYEEKASMEFLGKRRMIPKPSGA